MSFQNRYVDEKLIQYYFDNNKPLKVLFKNDTLVLEDKISSMVYELYCNGMSDLEIKNIINKQLKSMED
jgi:hypothetical protein